MNKAWSWWIRKVHPKLPGSSSQLQKLRMVISWSIYFCWPKLWTVASFVWVFEGTRLKKRETLWWHQETPTKRKRREHFPRPKWSQRTLVGSQRLRMIILQVWNLCFGWLGDHSRNTPTLSKQTHHLSMFQKVSPGHRFDEQKPTARYHTILKTKKKLFQHTICSNWNHHQLEQCSHDHLHLPWRCGIPKSKG